MSPADASACAQASAISSAHPVLFDRDLKESVAVRGESFLC